MVFSLIMSSAEQKCGQWNFPVEAILLTFGKRSTIPKPVKIITKNMMSMVKIFHRCNYCKNARLNKEQKH